MNIYNITSLKITSVLRVKTKVEPKERRYYPKILSTYELIYFMYGETKVMFGDTSIYDKPGEIIYLPKGVHVSGYYADVISDGECIDIFFDTTDILPLKAISESFAKNTNISALFVKIHQLWVQKETGYYNKCLSLFYAILSEMEVSEEKYIPQDKRDKLNRAVEYIHNHYCDSDFKYSILPKLCGISYTYFKKLFVENFHVLPSEYIGNLRIQYACELLATNKISVSQAAEMCGFNDLCYFSRYFKKKVGVSPSLYGK